MRVAIMQPYFFPYIGYFQLIAAVDKFVVYDDVNYIKGGWVNRNKILINHKESLFTVPLNNPSSFSKINTVEINQKLYPKWKEKLIKSLTQSYKKSPNFEQVFQLIKKILIINSDAITISELSFKAIKEVVKYLNIQTEIIETSTIYNNSNLKSQDRVLDICRQEGCTNYINPIGGTVLYDKKAFKFEGIQLNFIKSSEIIYQQFNQEFVPWLSIIDVLMFNDIDEVRNILNKYELI